MTGGRKEADGPGATRRTAPALTLVLALVLAPVLAFGAIATTAAPAAGDSARRPKVPFAGDLFVRQPGRPLQRIRLYHDLLRTRMDIPYPAPRLVVIADRERRASLFLLPDRREYVRIPDSRHARAMADRFMAAGSGLKPLGRDEIGGIPVTRFALVTRTDGARFKGHVWLTDDNIMIRTAGRTPKGPVEITLRNLRRGPVDPALFALPAGYAERKGK